MNLRKQIGRSGKRIGISLFGMISLLMMGQTASAQYPGSGGGGRQGGGFGAGGGSIGHFYGRIVDASSDKGMDGVSVQLVQSKFDTVTRKRKDTVIAGMITGRKGDFSLENLPLFGNFRIRITAIGYKTYEQKVAFEMKMPAKGGDIQQALAGVDKDLGNIKLSSESQTLEQVTVTASKPLITMGVDRKIYNVEKDISAQGGTGVDVMKNVPSVQVDIDGNVTLRNSSPTIFVDGRPTTLTLDQIPADAIASVEIITNPGAKYDASGGTSGILNIVLKKNRKAGYNGNIRAGLDQRGKFNLGADINVKQGKVNFFANANYGERKSISPGTTTRYTFPYSSLVFPYKTAPGDSLIQNDYNVSSGYFAFGRGGLDYLIDNRNTLSFSGTIVHGTFKPYTNSDLYVDTLNPGGNTTYSYTRRLSNTLAKFNNHGGMLSYKHTFPKSGEEWTADANYSSGMNDNTNNINSTIYPVKGQPGSYVYNQQQVGSGTNKFFTAQTDFVLPINDKSKFETGARIAIRNISSVNDLDTLGNDGLFHVNQLLSSQYSYRDRVFAGYVTYSNAVRNFNYQLGLRAESSDYRGTENYTAFDSNHVQQPTIGYFSNNFPISLFPSVFLTQKINDDQDLALNYTRRIDRPNFFQLFPFTDYSDSLNISRGNPDLQPQFTNSLELSYQKNYLTNSTFLASVYYKSTTNLITRYQVPGVNPITDSTVFINTYINAKSSFVGGLELIGRNSITRWWDITSNLNFFTSKINVIDTGKVAIPTTGQLYSWFGKINNTFKLPKNFTLQLTGDYTSKTVLPPGGSASNGGGGRGFGGTVSGNAQGYSRPSGGVDAALKYEFLKAKAASITLSVSDIFRTRVSDVFTTSGQFDQEAFRRRDPQFFRLQFNYRFGKFDVALFKRKNMKGEMENIQGSMQGVQQQPQ